MPTNFPNALDTNVNFPNITDIVNPTTTTTLVGNTDGFISVVSTDGYAPLNGLIVIGQEQITYAYTTTTQFQGCYRGFAGTPVTSHNVGSTVSAFVTAAAYTNLRDAILQIEQFIGANGEYIALTERSNAFEGSQQLSNGLLLNTEADTGLDQWTIAPTNDGVNAILNLIYVGNASNNYINIPGLRPHSFAFMKEITYAPTLVIDLSESPNWVVVLTGDVTSSSVINGQAGQTIITQIIQDSVGGHSFTFPSNFQSAPMLPKKPNTTNVLFWWFDGANAWPVGQTSAVVPTNTSFVMADSASGEYYSLEIVNGEFSIIYLGPTGTASIPNGLVDTATGIHYALVTNNGEFELMPQLSSYYAGPAITLVEVNSTSVYQLVVTNGSLYISLI